MSHFLVYVIGDNVDEQLEKYNENLIVDEYSKGVVSEKEIERFIGYYRKNKPLESKGLSLIELYELFGDDWKGCEWKVNENGQLEEFSTYNPYSKWDWWIIGGRWSNSLINKNGNKCDSLTISEYDYKKEVENEKKRITEIYNGVQKIIKEEGLFTSFAELKETYEDINKAKAEYWGQQSIKRIQDEVFDGFMFGVDIYEMATMTLDDYFKHINIKYSHIPYAFVYKGEWYSKGDMGWFGFSDDKDESGLNKYFEKFQELIDTIDGDTLLTAIDCHI
jgi:hypothetical protein